MSTFKTFHTYGYNILDDTNLDFKLSKPNRVLIKGYIVSADGKYLPNACIEVLSKNLCTNKITLVGITFADSFGFYAISLETSKNSDYIFNAYSPV